MKGNLAFIYDDCYGPADAHTVRNTTRKLHIEQDIIIINNNNNDII